MLYLLSMTRVQFEKVLPALSYSLDLRTNRYEHGSFILGATDYDAGNFVCERLS